MKRNIIQSARQSFSTFSVVLAILFILCAAFTFLTMKNINMGLLKELQTKQKVLGVLKNMRVDFANEHSAITYGLSENSGTAYSIYSDCEQKLRESSDQLKSLLRNQKDMGDVNTITYNQAMFSEQVNQMFNSVRARQGQSLTYDELVDLKSYTIKSLNEANKYAGEFNRSLNALEQRYVDDYNGKMSSLMAFLMKFKIAIFIFLGMIFIVAFLFGFQVLQHSSSPLQRASDLLKVMANKNYEILPDYSQVDDPQVKNILKSFNVLAVDFKNFAVQSSWSIREIIEINSRILAVLRNVKANEKRGDEFTTASAKQILTYSQDLENIRFYFDRIKEITDSIHTGETGFYNQLYGSLQKIDVMATSSGQHNSQIYVLSEICERIGLMAVNINIEASKLGDRAAGFTSISSEIRRSVLQAQEIAKSFTQMQNENKLIVQGLKENFGQSKKFFEEINNKIQEILTVTRSIEEIKESGLNTEAILMQNNLKANEIRKEAAALISNTEKEVDGSTRELEKLLKGHETLRIGGETDGLAPSQLVN